MSNRTYRESLILKSFRRLLPSVTLAVLSCVPQAAAAESALVAVAANFAEVANVLAREFSEGADTVALSVGSTGQLYARIGQGAPYDVFLAADQARPRLLVEQGHAVAASRFTYAVGRLALWSADKSRDIAARGSATFNDAFRYLAIANPAVAPYGVAAREVLFSLGVWSTVQARLVFGQNVSQVTALVGSGNADIGLVAFANVHNRAHVAAKSYWLVPLALHKPIRQDAVLTRHGRGNSAARRFLDYLRSPQAARHLQAYGFVAAKNLAQP